MAQSSAGKAWARGGMVFAATVMLIIGIFQIFEGIAAIAQDAFYVVGDQYAYRIDTTTWGWIHLGIGIIAAVTGFFLYTNATWARVVGIALAVVSATANFFYMPYYPLWALLIIGLDIFVIWALATAPSRTEMEQRAEAMAGGYRGDAPQGEDRWSTTNTTAGRHWAGEPAKESGARAGAPAATSEEMAHQGASRAGMAGPGQPGMGQPGMSPPSGSQPGSPQSGTGNPPTPPGT